MQLTKERTAKLSARRGFILLRLDHMSKHRYVTPYCNILNSVIFG
jgi:hypothetical protein